MAEDVKDWSTTAADNATADTSINWAEGQAPSTVNNSARSMMAAVAKWRDAIQWGQWSWAGTAGGTADALTVTLSIAPTAYVAGLTASFKAAAANTGPATLNVNGLGAKALQINGAALSAGDIAVGSLVTAVYDGTQFQVFRDGAAQVQAAYQAAIDDLADGTTPMASPDINGGTIDGADINNPDIDGGTIDSATWTGGAITGNIGGSPYFQGALKSTAHMTVVRNDGYYPVLNFDRDDAPGVNGYISAIASFAQNDADEQTLFTRILTQVYSDVDGSEGGHTILQSTNDGVLRTYFIMNGNGWQYFYRPVQFTAATGTVDFVSGVGVDFTGANVTGLGDIKAWADIRNNGTATIADSLNVTSVTRTGTGLVTVTWDTDFASANYAVTTALRESSNVDVFVVITAKAAGTCNIRTFDEDGYSVDDDFMLMAIGDQ